MTSEPLVSVVTPVYNGAGFLAECIESVLAQGYANLEHVILDNASTDETNAIAQSYGARDPRIRVLRNPATLPVIENWNRSLEVISPESTYVKTLHADDLLYDGCVAKMVELAEANPSVGVVGSLRLRGDRVQCDGLPVDRQVFRGADIARLFLRREVFAFAPTSGMVRSSLVRRYQPFYPTRYLHADLASYLQLLDGTDFGFIHEVLAFSRTHGDSITTTVAERRQTLVREWLFLLEEYGGRYFEREELDRLVREHLRRQYRILVRGAVTGRGRAFIDYHLDGLREARRTPSLVDLGIAVGSELAASIASPMKLIRHLRAAFSQRSP